MRVWTNVIGRALVSGTIASITSAAALVLLARAEGKNALQPVNATSHWLHGEQASRFVGLDCKHTLVGYATHHAATIFWALFYESWIGPRSRPSRRRMLADAVMLSAIAAAVDYGPTPKRFTPGWEFVLSKRAMAAAYAAMAVGLAAGSSITHRRRISRASRIDPVHPWFSRVRGHAYDRNSSQHPSQSRRRQLGDRDASPAPASMRRG